MTRWRVVRFTHGEPSRCPCSHLEYREGRSWIRATLHMSDAQADSMAHVLNGAKALQHEVLLVALGIEGAMGKDPDAARWVARLRRAAAEVQP